MNSQEIMNLVRQLLTFFFSVLATKGIVTSDQASALVTNISVIIPAIGVICSISWSVYAHWNQKKVPEDSLNIPKTPPAVKALVMFAIVGLGLLVFAQPGFAQSSKSKLPIPLPIDPLGLNDAGTTTFPSQIGIDLKATWDKITAATQPDLTYAKALADNVGSPGSKLRSQCYAAILVANQQANGSTLKNPDGSPMVKPDPAVITGVEQAAELVDNLSATAPLTAACAPAANALRQNVLQFITAIVTGAAAKITTGGLL